LLALYGVIFSRSVDVDIDKKGRKKEEDAQIDKGNFKFANDSFNWLTSHLKNADILKNLETISKMDSYEKLNDVRFEGFSSDERRQQRFHQETQAFDIYQDTSSNFTVVTCIFALQHPSLLDTPIAGTPGEVPVASLLSVDSDQERREQEVLCG
jgi:hypothetical protein